MPIYDNTLKDDYAHPHVRKARAAGRAWAEREASASADQYPTTWNQGEWSSSWRDTLPLVSFAANETIKDQDERERELAEIANRAACVRWAELCIDAESD